MGPGVLSILAIFSSFAILAITISKGLKPYQAILSSFAVILAFYFYKISPQKLLSSTFLNYPNMRTFGIVLFMLLLIGFMKYYGLTDRIAEAAKGVFKEKKWTVILIPSLIGLIPMPAGALISATLLKDVLQDLKVSPEVSTASNYWFRHIWEYFWFFYQSIIFESLITGVPLLKVMALQSPFTLTGMGVGILYYLRGIKGEGKKEGGAGRRLILSMWPVIAIICAVIFMKGISPLVKLPFSSADFLFWTIPAVILAMIIKYGKGSEGIKRASKSLSPSMLAAVIAALLYKSSVICSGAATDFSSFMISHHVPPLLLLSSIPFIVGLLTGISFVAVTVSFPIILPIISLHPLAYVPLAYAFAHFGMMLSPAHLCLILSNEYFSAKLSESYRHIFPVTASNTVIAFAICMAYLHFL